MHVHLPKPLHGWRAFAGEVAIIVLGVMIALGAEQVVETLHWRRQVELERAALHAEIRDNLDAVQSRMVLEPCVRARLAELQRLIDIDHSGTSVRLRGRVGLPLPAGGSQGAWSIAVSGDALTHMPLDEQLQYSNAFSNFANWDEMRRDERSAWIRIAVLDHPAGMTDADWANVRQAISEAVAADTRVADVGPFIFRTASVGERPSALTREELFHNLGYGAELCEPILGPPPGKAA
jgi:hypothetical protein